MLQEGLYNTTYNGTKKFSQDDVQTANATGFGAAADDYAERGIDLNEQLIMNKPATFFFKMDSDAMLGAGISNGDVLIVDRSIKAAPGKIIVAAVDGELLVRYYRQLAGNYWLEAANKNHRNIMLQEFTAYSAWGVVTCVVHLFEPALIAYNAPKKKGSKK
ncbi:LexA family protein [Parasediminibacterium sp. JCM 36343]|uniref:LexA family protein n=1 Tax=Parasediminibacterium sp. JCM 36343 TaxID=3374279 RepID=UPI00397B0F71